MSFNQLLKLDQYIKFDVLILFLKYLSSLQFSKSTYIVPNLTRLLFFRQQCIMEDGCSSCVHYTVSEYVHCPG